MKKTETEKFATTEEGELVYSSRSHKEWFNFAMELEWQNKTLQSRLNDMERILNKSTTAIHS